MGLRARILSFFLRVKSEEIAKGVDAAVKNITQEIISENNPEKVVGWINLIGSLFGKQVSPDAVEQLKKAYGQNDKKVIEQKVEEVVKSELERRSREDSTLLDKDRDSALAS